MARKSEQIIQNIIGENVKKYRIKRRMSQMELSIHLETCAIYICRGSISRIERHRRRVTDYELKALAKILKVTVENMFEAVGEDR